MHAHTHTHTHTHALHSKHSDQASLPWIHISLDIVQMFSPSVCALLLKCPCLVKGHPLELQDEQDSLGRINLTKYVLWSRHIISKTNCIQIGIQTSVVNQDCLHGVGIRRFTPVLP